MTQLERLLWPTTDPTDGRVHALLDGARDRRIESLIRWNRVDQDCLYSGDLSPRLQAAAPYIVRLCSSKSSFRRVGVPAGACSQSRKTRSH
jgi:hypothetical protein